MSYTIKIAKNEKEADRLIKLIEDLVGDSPLVSIYEDETGLSEKMEKELERRYQDVLNNPGEGKTWEDVKAGILRRE
jgi:hypothetical protein